MSPLPISATRNSGRCCVIAVTIPDQKFDIYRQVFNTAIQNRPKDMVVTTHLCRGNFRSTFVGSGGYDPIAEKLFNDLDVDGYFLEWDTDRAGGFEPLRLLPKGNKIVVLGLITSKTGQLEIARRHQTPD